MKIVIVGGVAGGATCAARLRRLDEKAEIIMFERGEYVSFANCGLPYYIGGDIKEKSALVLQSPLSFKTRFNVDARINSEVVAIDPKAKTVKVKSKDKGEYTQSYDKLVLSMGAKPIIPNIEGVDSEGVFTLRNIPDTYRIKDFMDNNSPKTVAIVGGGYIGVEMAENLSRLGLSVNIIEMSDQLIAPLDIDTACDVHNYLASKGIKLHLKEKLTKIVKSNNKLKLSLSSGELATDMVIMSVGVRPESDIAANIVECNARGGIKVDSHMRTIDKDIYAVGDAVEITDFVTGEASMVALAGPANKQGRIAADNICGINSKYGGSVNSSVLKIFDMTVATTGINEKTAKRLKLNYDKSFTYSASHAGYYPGANNMSVKTIFDVDKGRILGAQIVGFDGVDKRCDVFATAIRAKMTASDLTELELCYAPPFSSAKDPVNMAGYTIENVLSGKTKLFHWHEIPSLYSRDDVILLDVRTVKEHAAANINGFINIPVDELRTRLSELDKLKTIYVHCFSGFRSYLACRILSGNGFNCYNLSGGFRLYNSIHNSACITVGACETKKI